MKRVLHLSAAALLATAAAAAPAQPGDATQRAIEQYREMMADSNPAELDVDRGELLWQARRGPKQASLEACDLGLGPGVVKGAYAQLPRYFADAGRTMDFETRVVWCMEQLQGIPYEQAAKKPFSSVGESSTELEALSAWAAEQSRGLPVAVPQKHPAEVASFLRGEKIFFLRAGPYDFACATCHSNDNRRIRLQELPNLSRAADARKAYATWPGYRVSQGVTRSMQWRVNDCFRQQRLPELKYGSQAAVDVITYLGVRAQGGTLAAPALKR